MKDLWSKATPYIQMGGWLLVAIPTLISASVLIKDAQAYGARIATLEQRVSRNEQQNQIINQKLDLVIQFMRRK